MGTSGACYGVSEEGALPDVVLHVTVLSPLSKSQLEVVLSILCTWKAPGLSQPSPMGPAAYVSPLSGAWSRWPKDGGTCRVNSGLPTLLPRGSRGGDPACRWPGASVLTWGPRSVLVPLQCWCCILCQPLFSFSGFCTKWSQGWIWPRCRVRVMGHISADNILSTDLTGMYVGNAGHPHSSVHLCQGLGFPPQTQVPPKASDLHTLSEASK